MSRFSGRNFGSIESNSSNFGIYAGVIALHDELRKSKFKHLMEIIPLKIELIRRFMKLHSMESVMLELSDGKIVSLDNNEYVNLDLLKFLPSYIFDEVLKNVLFTVTAENIIVDSNFVNGVWTLIDSPKYTNYFDTIEHFYIKVFDAWCYVDSDIAKIISKTFDNHNQTGEDFTSHAFRLVYGSKLDQSDELLKANNSLIRNLLHTIKNHRLEALENSLRFDTTHFGDAAKEMHQNNINARKNGIAVVDEMINRLL